MSGSQDLIERIRKSVIGRDTVLETPFGPKRLTYADYTASGRSLSFVEDYIREVVLPVYANTHTETSGTGLQTTSFREEAREIIRGAVGGTDEHAVIFAGSGMTGAIDRLIRIIGLSIPSALESRYELAAQIQADERPVVFVGPYEHHSNELPWRESIADVIEIREDEDGMIDLKDLERNLLAYAARPLRIGSFSAASNVTGIVSDSSAISSMLHAHGALSFWDFAASAPYVTIAMGSADKNGLDYKDAVLLSPHKFIGGPGTPGVLICRRDLLSNPVPAVPGGGTVAYVNADHHTYLSDPEHREEGGTPAIIGSIRAGMVFSLKEQVGADEIRRREHDYISRAIESWSENPSIEIMGNPVAERLSIVSFVVRNGDRHLHYNFVVALLNDLFGIQSRGGCSCAGPYGHRLLGIDAETSDAIEAAVARGCEVIKPGWVRLNFNYFISEDEFRYIVDSVHLLANEGWKLMSEYEFEVETAVWRHRKGLPRPPVSLADGFDQRPALPNTIPSYDDQLNEARANLESANVVPSTFDGTLDPESESLRWFPTPNEVLAK